MASKAYEGNFKVWRLESAPATWSSEEEGSRVVTATELTAGTRLLRLISAGGFAYTYNQNTASQAKVDDGKISHSVGTREITGGMIVHEADHPLSGDAMWSLNAYGDQVYFVVAPNAPSGTPEDADILHIFEAQTGEPQGIDAPGQDTIENFQVGFAVQDWDLAATFDDESS